MEGKNDVILTSYCSITLAVLLAIPILVIPLFYLIGIYDKKPFLIFTGLYADGEYLLLLGLTGLTLLGVRTIYWICVSPFKIIFSGKGINIYSLWFLRPLFLRWNELTEFQVIEEQKQTSAGGTSYYVQIVIVSKRFSTKSKGSLGPLFSISKLSRSKNSDAAERILELYQKSQKNQENRVA